MDSSGSILIIATDRREVSRLESMAATTDLPKSLTVDVAGSLGEALRMLEVASTTVAIVDLHLPDSSGPDTIRALRAAAPEVPLVALVGHDDGPALEALAAGAHDCLPKEIVTATLLSRTIDHAIRRQSTLGRAGVHLTLRRRREQRLAERLAAGREFRLPGPDGDRTPLRVRCPNVCGELEGRYRGVIENRLPAVDVDTGRAADIELIADHLATFGADACDALELHRTAVDEAIAEAPARMAAGLEERGEYGLIELLALLANRYRLEALTTDKAPARR